MLKLHSRKFPCTLTEAVRFGYCSGNGKRADSRKGVQHSHYFSKSYPDSPKVNNPLSVFSGSTILFLLRRLFGSR